MPVKQTLAARDSSCKPVLVWTDQLEEAAERQLRNIATLPFVFKHVAAMPDVHLGKGATVGSVIATEKVVIPAAVGVDIGCGMAAIRTDLTSSDFKEGDVRKLRQSIENSVPVGFDSRKTPLDGALTFARAHRSHGLSQKHVSQLGTLGGGNHFIELCTDELDRVWIVLHSGSRNLGNTLASKHIEKAKKIMQQSKIRLADPDLAYFNEGTVEFDAYVSDLELAQSYAMENRRLMLVEVRSVIEQMFTARKREVTFSEPINCHHNYMSWENHFGTDVIVTRKGAIRAREGDMGIIPGSMGTKSYIVRGKGSVESFHSCSHGAGRNYSRTKAKQKFTVADLAAQTEGVECRKDRGVLDEIPSAYKNIEEVMANQSDLVEIVATLKQFMCVKG